MKCFNWDNEKNAELKHKRNVSFEEVIVSIEKGHLVDILDHPNVAQYGHQKIMAVNIRNYIYLVPFVEDEKENFLKTIIPSRKQTKKI